MDEQFLNKLKIDMYNQTPEDIVKSFHFVSVNDVEFDETYWEPGESSKTIMFDLKEYIWDIMQSYKFDRAKIEQQFNLDAPRSDIYIDGMKLTSENFQLMIQKFNGFQLELFGLNITLDIFIKMMVTQAVFALPFSVIHDRYTNTKSGLFVISRTTRTMLNFDDGLHFSLFADFNLININNNQIIKPLATKVLIDIVNFKFPKYGILLWN